MPYAVKFYAYIFVANVLVVVIVARWVKPFGFMASMAFCLAFAYLTIVTGRWLFGRKELRTRTDAGLLSLPHLDYDDILLGDRRESTSCSR